MIRRRAAILGGLLASVGGPVLPDAHAQSDIPPAGPSAALVTTKSFAGSRPADGRTTPDARRAQVEAATDDAIDILRRDVLAVSLAPDLNVRQFLYKTGGTDD